MPTYEYACTECGDRLEVVQRFSDDPLTVCPACGGKLRKVFSPVGIVFKGSGFYRTDSRSGKAAAGSSSAKGPEGSSGESAASSSDGAKSDSAVKSETAAKAGSDAKSDSSSSSESNGSAKNGKSGSVSTSSTGSGSKVA